MALVRNRERKFDQENVCFYRFQGGGVSSPSLTEKEEKPQAERDRV